MTREQLRTLDAIRRLTVDGVSPCYREIGVDLGCTKGNVHRRVTELRRDGFIHFDSRSRSITILTDNPAYTRPVLEALSTERLNELAQLATDIIVRRVL